MSEHKILWEKWQDPVATLNGGQIVRSYEPGEDEDEPEYLTARQTWHEDDEGEGPGPTHLGGEAGYKGPCFFSPFGIIPLHESNYPSKLFNFWMGHTNFDLTTKVVSTIEKVEGVETLDVFTRYRFRLGIGRLHSQAEVKKAVEACVQPKAKQVTPTADPMHERLNRTFKFWAIISLPNGKRQPIGGQTPEEVESKLRPSEANEVSFSWK